MIDVSWIAIVIPLAIVGGALGLHYAVEHRRMIRHQRGRRELHHIVGAKQWWGK